MKHKGELRPCWNSKLLKQGVPSQPERTHSSHRGQWVQPLPSTICCPTGSLHSLTSTYII